MEDPVKRIRRSVKPGHQNLRESIQETFVTVGGGGHGEATDVLGDGREGTYGDQRERRMRRWEAEKTTTSDVNQEIMLEKEVRPKYWLADNGDLEGVPVLQSAKREGYSLVKVGRSRKRLQ